MKKTIIILWSIIVGGVALDQISKLLVLKLWSFMTVLH